MSPPLLGTEGDGQGSVCLGASPSSMDCIPPNNLGLKERNYLGLSDCSSVDIYAISSLPQKKNNLNLKATELRLGLPGSQSPEREREPELSMSSSAKHEEKPLFSFLPSKDGINSLPQKTTNISGNKRVFSDAVDGFSKLKDSAFTEGNWMFHGSESQSPQSAVLQGKFPVNVMLSSSRASTTQPGVMKEVPTQERASTTQPGVMKEVPTKERPHASTNGASNNNSSAPAFKAQVVGWPPVRSFRKNTLATTSKNNDEVDGKLGPGPLFVKVSMDGAPYLRKVDLRNYSAYQELSSALEKMFSCFTLGQCGPHGGKEMLSETKLRYLLDGSEYVLTCEDKDGDWMLVGDVPWDMFINSCKRLKIMKSSDAIGLAPRAMEKSKNKK